MSDTVPPEKIEIVFHQGRNLDDERIQEKIAQLNHLLHKLVNGGDIYEYLGKNFSGQNISREI